MQSAIGSGMEHLEKVLCQAGIAPGVQLIAQESCKPWQSEEIKALIQERQNCNLFVERRRISKLIQQSTRKALRKYRMKKQLIFLKSSQDSSQLQIVMQWLGGLKKHPLKLKGAPCGRNPTGS